MFSFIRHKCDTMAAFAQKCILARCRAIYFVSSLKWLPSNTSRRVCSLSYFRLANDYCFLTVVSVCLRGFLLMIHTFYQFQILSRISFMLRAYNVRSLFLPEHASIVATINVTIWNWDVFLYIRLSNIKCV